MTGDINMLFGTKSLFIFLTILICSRQAASNQQQSQQHHEEATCNSAMNTKTVLVVGATGATGKHVVQQLLDKGHKVKAVVRSKERMEGLLSSDASKYGERLSLTEASLLDLTDDELESLVEGTNAVVSCLGHNMDFKGLWGKPRRLVTDATKRLTDAIKTKAPSSKFILMGSNGVANPNGQDDKRSALERAVIWTLRYTIPPHADNEQAAQYVHNLGTEATIEWSVVRPSDLIDGPVTEYDLVTKPRPGLFSPGSPATRSNVADCMVNMILNDSLWEEWKYKMPCLYDKDTTSTGAEATAEK
jgi:putative NADH-flavin reductase